MFNGLYNSPYVVDMFELEAVEKLDHKKLEK